MELVTQRSISSSFLASEGDKLRVFGGGGRIDFVVIEGQSWRPASNCTEAIFATVCTRHYSLGTWLVGTIKDL